MTDRLTNGAIMVVLVGFIALFTYFFFAPPVSQVFSEHEDLILWTPEPPDFDLAAVQARFVASCAAATDVDEQVCNEVDAAAMTGSGRTLYVPTSLRGDGYGQAMAICQELADPSWDEAGGDLGYLTIVVRKQNGGSHFPNGRESTCVAGSTR